mmetsp:Transcript_77355/g.125248  ORF Transcript_77355/g.125248 Transcript_77355/m.125248 type:complete len:447 (-) Transcript_77355:805-2145(-)
MCWIGPSMRCTKIPSICSSSFQSSKTERTWPMPKTSCALQSTLNRTSATRLMTADTTSRQSVPESAATIVFRAAVITIFSASHAMASQYFLASGSGPCCNPGMAGKCCIDRKRSISLQGPAFRARYPEVKSTKRLAAQRSSKALKPSVGYGSCGRSSMSFGITWSCPAGALEATPVSTKTHASISCQGIGTRWIISESNRPIISMIHRGVTTRHASVMLMEHNSRNRTNSSHSKCSSCSGSGGYRTACQCAWTIFSMCGARRGLSRVRRCASASGSLAAAHASAPGLAAVELSASSSKGSSSWDSAPMCCDSAWYQKSRPQRARSVWRSSTKCRAMSASPPIEAGTEGPSATTRRVKVLPSSLSKRPSTATREESSVSWSIHFTRFTCVEGSSCWLPATTASATRSTTCLDGPVTSLLRATASLSRSAQARHSSSEVPLPMPEEST